MLPSPVKRMTEPQRRTVNATLNAIDNKIHLDSGSAVLKYLQGLLSEDLLRCYSSEIIDCWIRIQADRNKQLLSPSRSLSDRSQFSPSDSSLDGDDRSEKGDVVAPTFLPNEPKISIAILCPSANESRPVSMRTCNGDVSYISEVFARMQLQAGRKSRIIINWSPVGKHVWAYTSCELIHPDQLPDCVVALAEDCGKEDTEDAGEEQEEGEEKPGNPEAASSSDCPPNYLGVLAELNIETAKRLTAAADSKANSKRKPSLPPRPQSSSSSQHKRPRY